MTTKHTPGPWCYFDDVDSPFWGEILTDSQRELYAAIDAKIIAAITKAKGQAE